MRPGGEVCGESGNCLYLSQRLLVLSRALIRYDELCRRFLNFISICHSSDSVLIRFGIKHALLYARMQSPVGRNYVLYMLREIWLQSRRRISVCVKSSCCSRYVSMQLSFTDCYHIAFAVEMLMLKADVLYTPVHSCVRVESGTNWLYVGCYWHVSLFIVFTFSSFYVCTLCKNFSINKLSQAILCFLDVCTMGL